MQYHNIENIFDEMIESIKYIKISSKFCNMSIIHKNNE